MINNIYDYVKAGDTIGIRGRIQNTDDDKNTLVAEKVTFLAAQKSVTNENDIDE